MGQDAGGAVVVGYDGSAESAEAVALALREAQTRGAELWVVTAYTADWTAGEAEPPDWRDRMRRQTEALQAEALAEAGWGHDSTVSVRHAVVAGNPGEVLVDAARDAALLVVGSRGHNPLARVLLGSVSTYCLHNAGCPVLVVRLHPGHPRAHLPSIDLAGRV